MAGLLDLANDPLMGLAGGLLGGGSFGQALTRGLTASQAMQLSEQERKLRESQAMENKARAQHYQDQQRAAQAGGQRDANGVSVFIVDKITPVAEAREGHTVFRVEGSLTGASERLRPGMDGVAKIEVEQRLLVWIWARSFLDWARVASWQWLR